MTKPGPIQIEGKDYFAWEYEDQTKVKHELLRKYYGVYLTKLGSRCNSVLFFDCHGGCGAYKDNNEIKYGSAFIVHEINKLYQKDHYRSQNKIIICESDPNNTQNLKKIRNEKKINCNQMKIYQQDYNDVIFYNWSKEDYTRMPTLFFIDPFGYYNTPIANMKYLMETSGNEILINFMFDFVNRGIGNQNIDKKQVNDFFGNDKWQEGNKLHGDEREIFLLNLYKQQLKKTTKAQYAFAFRLCFPQKDRTYYYLIHLTNHLHGIMLSKSIFTNINGGKIEYQGKNKDKNDFFDLEYYKEKEITMYLMKKFYSQTLTFTQILEEIIEDTYVIEKNLRAALKKMESEKKITVERITSKTSRGLREDDIICFEEK